MNLEYNPIIVDGKPTEKHPNPDYPGQQTVSFSLLWLCFISDQKTFSPLIESINKRYNKRLLHFTSLFFLAFLYA